MNCFQKLLSSWWRTTMECDKPIGTLLWIAFKNYYLRDEGQLDTSIGSKSPCCELLSKIIIFVMKDNEWVEITKTRLVVNCFQKLLSSWWRTTEEVTEEEKPKLWIAFKNYYLRDEGQLTTKWYKWMLSCELLSKIIIFVMKDNQLSGY